MCLKFAKQFCKYSRLCDFTTQTDLITVTDVAPPSVCVYSPQHTHLLAERSRWLRSHCQGCWPWKTTDSGKETILNLHFTTMPQKQWHMQTNTILKRYLIKPIGALWIIKGNQSFVTETHHPLAAVQVWQGEQFFAEHGHKASPWEPQGEPATRDDGLLSPRCHQMCQHRPKLHWGGEDHDSSASHERAVWIKELLGRT